MKAVIFDFDYTLGDTTGGILDCLSYGLAALGFPPAGREEMRRTIGLSLGPALRALTGCEDPAAAREFTRLFMERADEVMVPSAVLYPDALPLLRDLRARGTGTAVVTTKASFRIRAILDKFNARDAVDIIVGSDNVENEKPHPEALLKALAELDTAPSDALYVGDSTVDALCAKAAGVPFAAVLTGTTPAGDLEPIPHLALCRDLADLRQRVLGL